MGINEAFDGQARLTLTSQTVYAEQNEGTPACRDTTLHIRQELISLETHDIWSLCREREEWSMT